MIQMDIPAAFVCSQIFAYCARERLKTEPVSWTGRYTVIATLYAVAVIGPCGLYLFSGWPEWEMMYWARAVRMDTANFGNPWLALVGPLFLLALGAAAMVGFVLAHRWIAQGRFRLVLISLWLGVAVSLGMVLITPSAPMLIGHYQDYHAYMTEAVRSGSEWSYGVVLLGDWRFMVPWAASRELLGRFGLITFFHPAFFFPWVIDIALFFGSAFALSRWFKQQPGLTMHAVAVHQPPDAGRRQDSRAVRTGVDRSASGGG
jgi:hypothetical protein